MDNKINEQIELGLEEPSSETVQDKPKKSSRKKKPKIEGTTTVTGMSLNDIAENLKSENPESAIQNENPAENPQVQESAEVTENLKERFLKDVLGSEVGNIVSAKLMGDKTSAKNIPDLIVSDRAKDLPELLDKKVDEVLDQLSYVSPVKEKKSTRVQKESRKRGPSKKTKEQLTDNLFTSGKKDKEEKVPDLEEFFLGKKGDFTKTLMSEFFGKKMGGALHKSIWGEKKQEEEDKQETPSGQEEPKEQTGGSTELSEIVKKAVIEALDSKKLEIQIPEELISKIENNPVLADVSSKVNDIHERVSVKDITVGKGEKAETFRYDPLAPEGRQVKQITDSGKAGLDASKEGGITSDYQRVMNKASLLGSKMIEEEPKDTSERIPKDNVKEEAENLKEELKASSPMYGELKVSDKEEKDPVEEISKKIDDSTTKIINAIQKGKPSSANKPDGKKKEEKVPDLKEFFLGKPGDFRKTLMNEFLGKKMGGAFNKYFDERGKKKKQDNLQTEESTEDTEKNIENEIEQIDATLDKNSSQSLSFEQDMIHKVDQIIQKLDQMENRENKEDSAEKDEDRRRTKSENKKEAIEKHTREPEKASNKIIKEEQLKDVGGNTQEGKSGIDNMLKKFKGGGAKLSNIAKGARSLGSRGLSAVRGIGSIAARGLGTVASSAAQFAGPALAVAAAGAAGYAAGSWLNDKFKISDKIVDAISPATKAPESTPVAELNARTNKKLEGTGYELVGRGKYKSPSGEIVDVKNLPNDVRSKLGMRPAEVEPQKQQEPTEKKSEQVQPQSAISSVKKSAMIANDTAKSELSESRAESNQPPPQTTVVNNISAPGNQAAPTIIVRNMDPTLSTYNASIFDHPVVHPGLYQM